MAKFRSALPALLAETYSSSDNKTRRKVGKVVLEPNNGEGVHITSYVNQSYDYEITKSEGHLSVFFKGELLYEKKYDMCEKAPKLDTPFYCPIPAGKMIAVRDVAKMPSYIPKGSYKIEAYITDQTGKQIGCTYAEFKTGEESS